MKRPEDALNPRLLYDDKIVSPRLKDIYHEVDLIKLLDSEKSLKEANDRLNKVADSKGYKSTPMAFVGFYIPLDSYLPLDEPYISEFMKVNPDTKSVDYAEINVITGCELGIKVGTHQNVSRLTVVLGCVSVDPKITLDNITPNQLARFYEMALSNVNKIIGAYKLTPLRHNHDLGFVSVSNRDSEVVGVRFDFTKVEPIEVKSFEVHGNTFASIMHSRVMEPEELKYFRETLYHLNRGNSEFYSIVQNIIDAVDAKCNGDFERAIILADKFGELFLRYCYWRLLMQNTAPEMALEDTNNIRHIGTLISKLSKSLGLTQKQFKEKTYNEEWDKKCRTIRNTLNHNFLKFTIEANQAIEAINSTIKMVCSLADLVEGSNGEIEHALSVFKSTQWLRAAQEGSSETS